MRFRQKIQALLRPQLILPGAAHTGCLPWRRKLCRPVAEPGFAEAVVADKGGSEPRIDPPAITVELARGSRVTIFSSAPPALAAAALKALR